MADAVREQLASLGEVAYGPFDDEALRRELATCGILMVRLGRYVGADLMRHAPGLRYIVSATTGLDHVDMTAAEAAGVRVVSLRDCPDAIQDVSATAEHTMGLLLALVRNIPAAVGHVIDGHWNRDLFWGRQLRGKRLGIVGFGRIGAMVARYGAALGMEVVAHDTVPARIKSPAVPVSFEELLGSSDVVSVHVTAVPDNRHLIDAAAIARMQPKAVVINTARGFIVDEAALAEAISSARIAGAAVDVLAGEERGTIDSSPLASCARAGHNVLITPHIGGATREAIAQTEESVVTCLTRMLHAGGEAGVTTRTSSSPAT